MTTPVSAMSPTGWIFMGDVFRRPSDSAPDPGNRLNLFSIPGWSLSYDLSLASRQEAMAMVDANEGQCGTVERICEPHSDSLVGSRPVTYPVRFPHIPRCG